MQVLSVCQASALLLCPLCPDGLVALWSQVHKQALASIAWHARGDYFATVAPAGNTQVWRHSSCSLQAYVTRCSICRCHRATFACARSQAVMVHQLSKKATQNPFRKNKGRVVRVLFHPSQVTIFKLQRGRQTTSTPTACHLYCLHLYCAVSNVDGF